MNEILGPHYTSLLMNFLPFIIAAVLLALIMFLPVYSARKRRRDLENLAISSGFDFTPEAEELINLRSEDSQADFDNHKAIYENDPIYREKLSFLSKIFARSLSNLEFTGLEFFSIGHLREASNMIAVPFLERKIYFFDYTYTQYGRRHSIKYSLTVALFKSKNNIPSFSLRPENFMDKMVSFFGYKDINFDSYPKFSKRYYLRGDNEVKVKSFFSDSKISFLEQNHGWTIFGHGRFICLYKKNNYISPEEYLAFIEETRALLKVLID